MVSLGFEGAVFYRLEILRCAQDDSRGRRIRFVLALANESSALMVSVGFEGAVFHRLEILRCAQDDSKGKKILSSAILQQLHH